MRCEICQKTFGSTLSFIQHIRNLHNLSSQKYYDSYILNDSENVCDHCGVKETKYINIISGYRNYCSRSCAMLSEETKKKFSTNPFQRKEVKDKIKATNIERYGVEYAVQSNVVKEKTRKTNLDRYGTVCSLQSDSVKKKTRKTNLDRYGNEHFSKSNLYREKVSATSLVKYGVPNVSMRHYSEDALNTMNNRDSLGLLYQQYNQQKIGEILGVSQSSISSIFQKNGIECNKYYGQSGPEKEIFDFIREIYTGKIVTNDRKTIGIELDIYLPEKKIAIEFDGLYWHSSKFKSKNFHLDKTMKCEELGIQLFHIFEDEWHNKKDIWKSVLKNALGICDLKIGARKTDVRLVGKEESKRFFEINHLQGSCQHKICYGLYFNDVLVAAMSFGKSRFNKKYDWELLRFCNKLDHVIIGGASRLLNIFRKQHLGSIVSYANRRWSMGNLYETLKFEQEKISAPNYFYFRTNRCVLESRHKYQKHKLKNIENFLFDDATSEQENMLRNGFLAIHDSGNKVYTLNY